MTNMPDQTTDQLRTAIERRNEWLRAGVDREASSAYRQESPFVMDVMERCLKLRYELAADRFFSSIPPHGH